MALTASPAIPCSMSGLSRATRRIKQQLESTRLVTELPCWDESRVTDSDEEVVIHNWHELRLFMWDYVGIVRTEKRLERALAQS